MSLHYVGMSMPFSPWRRQFPSQLAGSSPGAANDCAADADDELSDEEDGGSDSPLADNLTQDSKDVLVDRLNDLVQRLSGGGGLHDAKISALHAKVDQMETALAGVDKIAAARQSRRHRSQQPVKLGSPMTRSKTQDESFWALPRPPSWLVGTFSDIATSAIGQQAEPSQGGTTTMTPSETADKIRADAEKLCAELNGVLANLKARKQESDARAHALYFLPRFLLLALTCTQHLYQVLIDKLNAAAHRIVELEEEVEQL
jgi:hypothetical protein